MFVFVRYMPIPWARLPVAVMGKHHMNSGTLDLEIEYENVAVKSRILLRNHRLVLECALTDF